MTGPCSVWGLNLLLVKHPEKLDSQSGRIFPFPSQPLRVLRGPLLTRLLFPYVSRHSLLSLPWREQWELGTAGGGEVGWEKEGHCCGYLSLSGPFSLLKVTKCNGLDRARAFMALSVMFQRTRWILWLETWSFRESEVYLDFWSFRWPCFLLCRKPLYFWISPRLHESPGGGSFLSSPFFRLCHRG